MAEASETDGLSTVKRATDRVASYTVVDTDVHHALPKPDWLAKYARGETKTKLEHLDRTDEPLGSGVTASVPYDIDPTPHGLGDDIKATNPDGIKNFMELFNTDYVTLHGHGLQIISNVPGKDFITGVCEAHNDLTLTEFCSHYDGLKTGIAIATQSPEHAVTEIDRLADEEDMVSVHISAPVYSFLGDEKFDPIYEAAEDADLPITYHITAFGRNEKGTPFTESTVEELSVAPHHMFAHVADMIFSGVPEKFPDVDHVFQEQGIVWLPWLMGRMDKTYERRKHDLPWLEKRPSEYLRENFYFSTQPLEDAGGPPKLRRIFEIVGTDNIMYSTDFPHFDVDLPSTLTIPSLEEADERAVFGGNAVEVFDL